MAEEGMIAMIGPLLLTTLLQAQVSGAPPQPPTSSAPTHAASQTLTGAVKDLPHAFARLKSWTAIAVLSASGGAAAAVHPEDRDLTMDAAGSRTVDRLTEGGSIVGSGYVQVGGAAAVWLTGVATSHPAFAGLGADLLEAQAINGVLTSAVKYTVQRRRPDGGRYSFPSGHTSATFATAAVLENHYGLRAGLPAYALGAYVAGARLHDRKHFASDTLMGAGIGLVAGHVTRAHGSRRATAAIVPLQHGIAVAGSVTCPW
jgi:membrane-associated phospholipid phosphatase